MTETAQAQCDSNTGEFQISADPSKYVTLPLQNEAIWRKYQLTLDTLWVADEVNIQGDKQAFMQTFTDEKQRRYILKVIGLIWLVHDKILKQDLFLDLINHVDIKEASYYFGSQTDVRRTHKTMYEMLLNEFVGTDEEMMKLIKELLDAPEVRNLLDWYQKGLNNEVDSFAKRMMSLATLQGITLAVPYMIFAWLEKQHPSKMSGLMKSNQLIWRDEKLNLSFSCMLFDYIDEELDTEQAHEIIEQSVTHAKSIFTNALPTSDLGIDCESMAQFIEHSADTILTDSGHSKIYKIEKTPFDWIVEPIVELSKPADMPYLNTTANDSTTAQASFEIDDDF